jgi:uncharacterized membrane protein
VEPEAPPESQPVAVASVVRGLGGGGAVRITIQGTWRTAPDARAATLLVDDGNERHEIPALPWPPGDDPSEFHAAFDLPPALGGVSGDRLVLAVAGAEIALPAALPSVPPAPVRDVAAEAPPVPAEVVDRAVLAEHRARRAEQSLEGLGERLRTLEAHLGDVTADRDRLREELSEAEQAEERRLAALQEQLARLRESAVAAEGLQAALASARGEHEARARKLAAAQDELVGLRDELDAIREELGVVREERDGLRDAVARADQAVPDEHAAELAELGDTARVLRERAEDQMAARLPAEPPAGEDPFDVALAELRARTQPPPEDGEEAQVIPFDPLRNTMNLAAMSPGRRARSRLRRVAPTHPRVLEGDTLEAERRSGVAWLAEAIAVYAADDVRGAGEFVVSLLPDVARTLDEDMVFDVDLEGAGAHRVAVRGGAGSVGPREDGAAGDPVFTISGPVSVLARLGAGGAPRRLRGARVRGSRRALRRLLKTRRPPVDLGDLAAGGVVPDPALLLSALAAGVRPSWVGESEFAVAVDVPGRDPITVVAEPGRRLQVLGAPPEGGAVGAVLTTSPAALLALLGRVAPPEGDDAWLSGEEEVMTTLLELLDRAQGLPSRH